MQTRTFLVVIFVAFHIGVMSLRADEPGSWAPFDLCSDDGRYCAEVAAIDGDVRTPWNRSYRLTVTRKSDDGDLEFWSAPYRYDGYPGGMIAPDGKTFVYVNYWFYSDEPVVRIYREDGRLDVVGSAFNIPESTLIDTASHQLWLSERQPAYGLLDDGRLQIRTIDGVSHLVNLSTGTLEW